MDPKCLTSMFKMKDLTEVDTIMGIKVKKYSGGFSLFNLIILRYLTEVLTRFEYLKIKEVNTPCDSSIK